MTARFSSNQGRQGGDRPPLQQTKTGNLRLQCAMRSLRAALLLTLAVVAPAQTPSVPNLQLVFNFEGDHAGPIPRGWGGGPPSTIFVDREVVHSGRAAVRLERTPQSPNPFSTLTLGLPLNVTGEHIEWRGFLKTESVTDYVGLWMREDGDTPSLAFDNMQRQQVKGTNDWTAYSITLPIHPRARQLAFGVLIAGTGKVWADDLELLVDGKPFWEAPRAPRPITALDRDHEFDAGSRIAVPSLTPVQIENLSTLGAVWGFLKYHHPGIVEGKHHWDFELFRVLPEVLGAPDRARSNAAMAEWIRALGVPAPCTNCVTAPEGDLYLTPEIDWIHDEARLGPELATLLSTIHERRESRNQFFVAFAPNVSNPIFQNEPGYTAVRFPDAGYQLLALFRYWNIIRYWYPNRDLIDDNWDDVLKEFIPRVVRAQDRDAYQLEMLALIAKVTDTHANLNVPVAVRPPAGACQLPLAVRFVADRAVVAGHFSPAEATASPFKVGDVIESLDGVTVAQIVDRVSPHYPASNDVTRLRDIARALTKGPCAAVNVTVSRGEDAVRVTAERLPLTSMNMSAGLTHDLPGPAFQILPENVAYLKLSQVRAADLPGQIRLAAATRGLIVDIRNYPSEFVVFALGSLLMEQPTSFARFTTGMPENPGAFRWTDPVTILPQQPVFGGPVVILVDETSVSQAEYTAMALRASPRAIVVGSTTAGADGNVSQIPLPGGLVTNISGIGVFYPDKQPTQRVGILSDIDIRPTIAGIQAGKDEVLEEAIRQILDPQLR